MAPSHHPVVSLLLDRTRRHGAALLGPALLLAGCVSSPAAHTPGAAAPPPPPSATPVPAARLAFRYAPGHYVYDVSTSGLVYVAPDTATPADTVRSTAVLRLDLAPGADGQLLVSGTVDSIISRASRDSTAVATPSVPFHGVIDASGTLLSLQGADTAACNDDREVAFAIVRYGLPTIPMRLASDAAATDTLTVHGCRAGIPITATSVRTYRLAAGGSEGVGQALERSAALSLSGSGVHGADSVTISGQGSAIAELHVDPATGRFVSSVEHSAVTIDFAATGIQRQFRQVATISVRIR